jgi:hypothetical protein
VAAQRIHLERLPAYAPELNLDAGLWQQLKNDQLLRLHAWSCARGGTPDSHTDDPVRLWPIMRSRAILLQRSMGW